tara:strand:- start:1971 stop:2804 length:834 start_codon:yes stop_codon:yes gene_type:complete
LKKTILLIGSNGYIGTKLKKALNGNFNLINTSKKKGFDISNPKSFDKYFTRNIDIIINLSGQSSNNTKLMKKTIINGNKNLINFCKKKNIIVYYFSTSLIYGFSNKIKKETSSKNPRDYYSKYKYLAEKEYLKSNINYKILRLCNIYNGKKSGIVKNITDTLLKNKKLQITNSKVCRNYIYVNDLINIVCKMIKKNLKHTVYNIGFENIKIIEMIRILEKKLKIKLNYVDQNLSLKKIPSQKISINKVLKEIKYKPKVKLKNYLTKKYYSELKILKK